MGYKARFGNELDPAVAITRYLKSQCKLDRQQRDVLLTYNLMLKLCTHHIDKNIGIIHTWPGKHDRPTNFLFNNEDPASHILMFFGSSGARTTYAMLVSSVYWRSGYRTRHLGRS